DAPPAALQTRSQIGGSGVSRRAALRQDVGMSTSLRPARAETAPVSLLDPVIRALDRIIVGKTMQLRLCVACLLARGHLLIDDLPGVGKTTLAHALAKALGLDYQRVQFTSDPLPAAVIGVSVFNRDTGRFEFHKGPLFSQV